MQREAHYVFPLALALFLTSLLGCQEDPQPIERDWEAIQQKDTLVALTAYNSTSYFLYRGQPMGYEYELLQAFADEHDLALRMEVVQDRNKLYDMLNRGEGDLVAARVVPTAADSSKLAFTRTLYRTRPSIVQQRAPAESVESSQIADTLLDGSRRSASDTTALPDSVTIKARLVNKPSELTGNKVYVPGESGYEERLVELADTMSGDIQVVEVKGDVSSETLIRRVAKGNIELTASHQNLAKLRQSYYTNITVQPTLGPPQQIVWALRENSPQLKSELDSWIGSEKGGKLFNQLYEKYFVDRQGYTERITDQYLTSETGKLSAYDDLLQQYADSVGWDWRLLASQTYQESRFDPRAQSWAGAKGLLQLMPGTAAQVGIQEIFDPEANVRGATRYINYLQDFWKDEIRNKDERRKFILASYNAGPGHVQDAQRLAQKNGDNPKKWEEVAYWLLQKSKRKYYSDPIVKHGFCRGLEPVTYVSRIMDRFQHYQEFADMGSSGRG